MTGIKASIELLDQAKVMTCGSLREAYLWMRR
jgi:hypothetical protein